MSNMVCREIPWSFHAALALAVSMTFLKNFICGAFQDTSFFSGFSRFLHGCGKPWLPFLVPSAGISVSDVGCQVRLYPNVTNHLLSCPSINILETCKGWVSELRFTHYKLKVSATQLCHPWICIALFWLKCFRVNHHSLSKSGTLASHTQETENKKEDLSCTNRK